MDNTVIKNLIYNQLFAAANYDLIATIAPDDPTKTRILNFPPIVKIMPICSIVFIKKKILPAIIQLFKNHNFMAVLLNLFIGC